MNALATVAVSPESTRWAPDRRGSRAVALHGVRNVAPDVGLREPDEFGRLVAGRYRLETLLGHGAFGSVYRARDLSAHRPVALKLLRAAVRSKSSWVQRFRREALALARLDHPHVVRELDFGRVGDGTTFLVMELLSGNDLDQELIRSSRLSLDRTLAIGRQVCSALQATHDVGVIHRDVKPGNVYLHRDEVQAGPTETVKVLDFGIATMIDGSFEDRITVEDTRLGTLEYMAPERYGDEECVTGACDVYSLGCMLYQMLTGRLPFVAGRKDLLGLARQHLLSVPTSLRDDLPNLPRPVDELVLRTLEKCPAARPTAAELGQALATIADVPTQ